MALECFCSHKFVLRGKDSEYLNTARAILNPSLTILNQFVSTKREDRLVMYGVMDM